MDVLCAKSRMNNISPKQPIVMYCVCRNLVQFLEYYTPS